MRSRLLLYQSRKMSTLVDKNQNPTTRERYQVFLKTAISTLETYNAKRQKQIMLMRSLARAKNTAFLR
jgi:hypothetical protein